MKRGDIVSLNSPMIGTRDCPGRYETGFTTKILGYNTTRLILDGTDGERLVCHPSDVTLLKSQTQGYMDLIDEQAEPAILHEKNLPIDAEWLETQGWKGNEGNRVMSGDIGREALGDMVDWYAEDGVVVFHARPLAIKTRGELRTFLAFFGDA